MRVTFSLLTFRPHQPIPRFYKLGEFVGVGVPPFVEGVIQRRPWTRVDDHLNELDERQAVSDVVPCPMGSGQIAPNRTLVFSEDPDEGDYSPSSIPANSAH